MAIALPQPDVPSLGADNTIDLVELGNDALETYIKYPGIDLGHQFWPNWRGCSSSGEVIDYFNDLVTVEPDNLTPKGARVYIANAQLKSLDQGWVFYSYQMDDPSAPGGRGEESLRRFFYVGKRPAMSLLLPVPQFKESHDLKVDLSLIGPGGATVVTLPYQAMSAGDKVTLTIELAFDEDDPGSDYVRTKTLTDEDVGKPLQWKIPRDELEINDGGFATLSCKIVYATPTVPSASHKQELRIIKPATPLLPPPAVKDFDGDMVDPEAYPDGMPLVLAFYPDIQLGDDVVLYANGETRLVKTVRVDQTTIDSQKLEIVLDYQWLVDNTSYEVSLEYQYARVGSAGASQPLTFTLRKPLNLPYPIIENVTSEDVGEGFLLGRNTTGGVYIKLPEEAEIGAADKVRMVWDGYPDGGYYIAEPTAGNPQRFQIPRQYMPANLGKRLWVFYEVTPTGEQPSASKRYNLLIKDMTSGWPILQLKSPPAPNLVLSLATVTSVVNFELASWTFKAQGQRIRIRAEGVLQAGGKEHFNLRVGDSEVVTEDEYYADRLSATLSREFLAKLKLNEQFDVIVDASFDGGYSYKQFPRISPQLIA